MEHSSGKITIFCCYAHKDSDILYELKLHMSSFQRRNVVTLWDDGDINAGTDWKLENQEHLNNADIILLLLSADFIASDYCYSTQLQHALERHERRETCVVPILIRPLSGWETIPPGSIKLGDLQSLPKNAEAVTTWANRDLAWKEVVEEIGKVITELPEKPSIDQPSVLNQQWPISEDTALQGVNLYSGKRKKIRSHKGLQVLFSILLLLLLLAIIGIPLANKHEQQSNSSHVSAAPVVNTSIKNTSKWNLLINDDKGWNDNPPECELKNGMYHIFEKEQNYCTNNASISEQSLASLQNYTYEIQEAILRGQQGGIIFCMASVDPARLKTNHAPYYYFGVTMDGRYNFLYDDGNGNNNLINAPSSYIFKGPGKFNKLSVTIYNKEIALSINDHKVNEYKETAAHPCNGGVLGVELTASPLDSMGPTEAVYKGTRLWGP